MTHNISGTRVTTDWCRADEKSVAHPNPPKKPRVPAFLADDTLAQIPEAAR